MEGEGPDLSGIKPIRMSQIPDIQADFNKRAKMADSTPQTPDISSKTSEDKKPELTSVGADGQEKGGNNNPPIELITSDDKMQRYIHRTQLDEDGIQRVFETGLNVGSFGSQLNETAELCSPDPEVALARYEVRRGLDEQIFVIEIPKDELQQKMEELEEEGDMIADKDPLYVKNRATISDAEMALMKKHESHTKIVQAEGNEEGEPTYYLPAKYVRGYIKRDTGEFVPNPNYKHPTTQQEGETNLDITRLREKVERNPSAVINEIANEGLQEARGTQESIKEDTIEPKSDTGETETSEPEEGNTRKGVEFSQASYQVDVGGGSFVNKQDGVNSLTENVEVKEIPEEILDKEIYIYRGTTQGTTEDGYPGEEGGESYWAPTPHLPLTAMGGVWNQTEGLYRAKVKVRNLLTRTGDSTEVCDFAFLHDEMKHGILKDVEMIESEKVARMGKSFQGYRIGQSGKPLGEGEVPKDLNQFKEWVIKNKDNSEVFPDLSQ